MQENFIITCKNKQANQHFKIKEKDYGGSGGGGPFPKKALTCGLVK